MAEYTPTQGETWDCICGRKGNTTNFCPNCGMPKPLDPVSKPGTGQPRQAPQPGATKAANTPEDILWVDLPANWHLETAELDYNQPSITAPFRIRADASGGHAYVYWLERAIWHQLSDEGDRPTPPSPTLAWMMEQASAPWMSAEDYVDWLAREYAEDCDATAVFLEERPIPCAGIPSRAELEQELLEQTKNERNRIRLNTGVAPSDPWPVVLGVERRSVCRVYRLVRSDGFEALLAIGLVYQAVKRGRTLPRTSFHDILEDNRRTPRSLFERDETATGGAGSEASHVWQTGGTPEERKAPSDNEHTWRWNGGDSNIKANFRLKFDLKDFDLPDIAEVLNGIELPDLSKYFNDDGEIEFNPGDIVDVLFGDSPIGQMIRNAPGEWRWAGEQEQQPQPESAVRFDELKPGQIVEWGGTGITYLQATTAEFEQAYNGAFAQFLGTARASDTIEWRRTTERGDLSLRIAREG